MGLVFSFLFVVCVWLPLNLYVGGYTLSQSWNMFIPEIFPTLPPLTLVQAVAILVVVSAFKIKQYDHKSSAGKSVGTIVLEFLSPLIYCGITLILAHVVKNYFWT